MRGPDHRDGRVAVGMTCRPVASKGLPAMRKPSLCLAAVGLFATLAIGADDPIFSGPQAGETLTPFTIRGVYDAEAGQPFDPVSRADGRPILLVFVHEVTRPSIALVRALGTYAARQSGKGVAPSVVWLADDVTAAEQLLRRARHALPTDVPIGISTDGAEGPGAYGLNRNVAMTVLVGEGGKVTSNFALVQPSVQADGPKILAEVAALIDARPPTADEVAAMAQAPAAMRAGPTAETDPRIAGSLRALIRKDAEPAEVDRAAAAIESTIADDPKVGAQVGQIARRIVDSGRLESYGTPRAREHLKTWADRHAPESPKSTDRNGR